MSSRAPMLPLQAVVAAELAERIPGVTEAEARKLLSAVHRTGALPLYAPPPVRREALAALRAHGGVPSLSLVERRESALDPFIKYAFSSSQGEGTFETVRIPLEKTGRVTVCVSSQVGCALACRFCATGRMGLVRNLAAWEIVEQVRRVRAELGPGMRVHGVVFQGMGEPLANLKNVVRAARVLSDPCGQAIDARAITICTSGLPAGIDQLAHCLPNVRLAWSIGSALPDERRRLMPIEASHGTAEVVRAIGRHTLTTGHAPLFAYTLLAGVNDSVQHARALAGLVRSFTATYGIRPRVSLIPYNPIAPKGEHDDDPFARTDDAAHAAFADALHEAGVGAHRRYSGGADVGAACGQLGSGCRHREGDRDHRASPRGPASDAPARSASSC